MRFRTKQVNLNGDAKGKEACGEYAVYGAEELLIYFAP